MDFYTSSGIERPKRLSEKTRQFAYESINFKYGQDTLKTMSVSLDHIENYESLTDLEKYNAAIYEIATKAPIRICENELLSGAATLGDAIAHNVPAVYKNDKNSIIRSVSHLTPDFFEAVNCGIDSIREKAVKSLAIHTEPSKCEFLKSCIHCIDCMKIYHERYINALSEKLGYEKNINNLKQVPFKPATSFYEAVQSLWFCFSFLRLCGNWPGIGRIDVMLGKYLDEDLKNNKITLNEAREILAHLFIKGCEWITGRKTKTGDAQHYQNIILSGIDEDGNDVTNQVTYLVLDIIEETGISDFPTTVRVNKNTSDQLLKRVSEVIRYGGGIVAVYNEDLILKSLKDMGYPEKEARSFANDGCWEVQIPGKTRFSYVPFDGLKILQEFTLNNYDENVSYDDFDSLFLQYERDLKNQIELIFEKRVLTAFEDDKKTFKPLYPSTVISIFEHPCIENGMSYYEGGTEYTVISPHIGGLPDVANSLYAIKKVVFDDKIISFSDFMTVLRNDWENNEELRKHILTKYEYFGNDNDEADEIVSRVLDSLADICASYADLTPAKFVSGVSTFGRQVDWAKSRSSAPFGRKKGEVLSGNFSPTPGTDRSGVPAIIKSYCKSDLSRHPTGSAIDIGLVPSNIVGENGLLAISGLIKSFVALGGFFMQIDTADKSVLEEAQKHPENYQNLSVRVSGWNARFVTMNKEWQDMIIERSK